MTARRKIVKVGLYNLPNSPPQGGGGKKQIIIKEGRKKRISTDIFIATQFFFVIKKENFIYFPFLCFHLNSGSKKCIPYYNSYKIILKYQLFPFPDFVISDKIC